MTTRSQLIVRIVEQARSYVGFRSRANRVNGFGAGVRQDGKAWDGSFLETVMFESKVEGLPSLVSTSAALGWFVQQNRVFTKPKIGDLVFYAWSSGDDGFGQPHVGVVTEARDYKRDRVFKAVEGMVESGQPKGPQDVDGVYERVRYASDVIAFARPLYVERVDPKPDVDPGTLLRPSSLQHGKTNAQVVTLQLALNDVLGNQAFTKGAFDRQTVAAVKAFQRLNGLVPANGEADEITLMTLARKTGYRFFTTSR